MSVPVAGVPVTLRAYWGGMMALWLPDCEPRGNILISDRWIVGRDDRTSANGRVKLKLWTNMIHRLLNIKTQHIRTKLESIWTNINPHFHLYLTCQKTGTQTTYINPLLLCSAKWLWRQRFTHHTLEDNWELELQVKDLRGKGLFFCNLWYNIHPSFPLMGSWGARAHLSCLRARLGLLPGKVTPTYM